MYPDILNNHDMPKQPRPHVLRKTRGLAGLSRAELAKKVGVATVSLKQIEAGMFRPSGDLADRIQKAIGLDASQLMENFDPENPRDIHGILLTAERYAGLQDWRKESESPEKLAASVKHFAVAIQVVFDAATINANISAFRGALQHAIDKLVDDFDLGAEVVKLLKERYGVSSLWRTSSPHDSLYVAVNAPLPKRQAKPRAKASKKAA